MVDGDPDDADDHEDGGNGAQDGYSDLGAQGRCTSLVEPGWDLRLGGHNPGRGDGSEHPAPPGKPRKDACTVAPGGCADCRNHGERRLLLIHPWVPTPDCAWLTRP